MARLARARTPRDPQSSRRRPLVLAGVLVAGWTAGLGLLTATAVVLLGWASDAGSSGSVVDAARAAGVVWLAAHHAAVVLPGGSVGLLPLGLVVASGLLLHRAGGWLVRAAHVGEARRVGPAITALVVPYVLVAAAVAGTARLGEARVPPWLAAATGLVVAAVFGGTGVLRGAREKPEKPEKSGATTGTERLSISRTAVAVFRAGVGGAATLTAAGALLVAGALAAHGREVVAVTRSLDAGVVGGALLMLIAVAYLPNVVLWAVAYCVGPGFSVGAATSVSPAGIRIGDLPAFPLLAGLPGPGAPPGPSMAALAAPVVAGGVTGLLVARSLPLVPVVPRAACAAAAGGVAGLVIGVLAALSGGPLGPGRLTAVGPSGWLVGLAAGAEVAIVAAGVASSVPRVVQWRRSRR